MKNRDHLFTMVDGFRIPSDKADEYKRMRDKMAAEGEKFLRTFCVTVKKQPLFDLVGDGICGYSASGEMLARISLDPFELSAMNVAFQRKKLKEYILAANGYDENDYQTLLAEYEEAQKKSDEA
jgi:hypothetical protein